MDIRIKRTKEMINNALLELLKEKPIEKITPTELCRKATINRNTFYSHYKSTAEVFDNMENKLLKTVDETINESDNPTDSIATLCRLLKANKKLSVILFNNASCAKIVKKAFEITNKFNMSKMNKENNDLSENYKQMLSAYTIYGSAAIVESWVKNSMIEEPDEIAQFIYKVSKYGSSSVTKSE